MKLNRRLAALVPIAALVAALWSVSLPYFAEGPGPARDVEPLIRVTGHDEFPSRGHFILTSVGFTPVNAFQAIGAWSGSEPLRPLCQSKLARLRTRQNLSASTTPAPAPGQRDHPERR